MDITERAKMRAGDKLAVVSMEKDRKISLKELENIVKSVPGRPWLNPKEINFRFVLGEGH